MQSAGAKALLLALKNNSESSLKELELLVSLSLVDNLTGCNTWTRS